jgi:hypothetical protein
MSDRLRLPNPRQPIVLMVEPGSVRLEAAMFSSFQRMSFPLCGGRSCRLPELIGPKVPGRVTEHPLHSEIRSSRHDPAPGISCEGRKPCAQTISRVEGKDEVTTTRTASEWRDEWWLLRPAPKLHAPHNRRVRFAVVVTFHHATLTTRRLLALSGPVSHRLKHASFLGALTA